MLLQAVGQGASEFIFSKKATVNKTLKPVDQLDQSTIYFKRFNNQIDGSMDGMVNDLIALMKTNADIRIHLVGHTDAIEPTACACALTLLTWTRSAPPR